MRVTDEHNTEIEKKLFDVLKVMLRSATIDQIKTNDIIAAAGISRATFYRRFQDKYDLLNRGYEEILKQTLYQVYQGAAWSEGSFAIWQAIKEDIKFFQNALQSTDMNSLKNYIFQISLDLHLYIMEQGGEDISDWKTVTALKLYLYGSIETMLGWIRNGMQEPIEDMVEVFHRSLPVYFARHFH